MRKARERTRTQAARQLHLPPLPQAGPTTLREAQAFLRRQAATVCAWCGGPIEPKARGRIPKWCSASCRQRAWEQSRAAASGRSAVQLVERRVEIPVRHGPTTPPVPAAPRHQDWLPLLTELATQLDNGALYDRDLPTLTVALNRVLDAFARRRPARR